MVENFSPQKILLSTWSACLAVQSLYYIPIASGYTDIVIGQNSYTSDTAMMYDESKLVHGIVCKRVWWPIIYT